MLASISLQQARALHAVTLILGGVRSGKSSYAENLVCMASQGRAVYLATADASQAQADPEMCARIEHHRSRRGGDWTTIEEPLALADALLEKASPETPVLVDCLTLWLSNLMDAGRDVEVEINTLETILPRLAGAVVFISNEVGLGIVPENATARAFRDHVGLLHQRLTACADRVVFMVAGLPSVLKDPTLVKE
ncbi:MAG: bifunctional adenosylcobinamide kinase/adenosylcobinamide-phosphate guanylyltransferase [Alphaproteobacteria bacterium]|jgi:adenosylcobinamide kinase/adenosylcobinamide-phosphate guanylyltransferase|nr:bifunctional adenosylcobinamide kinase/adenosylcobinamide-phosphate guanylyltransferase [Alphaproteobacteria bacterium]MDP7182269.1 bifunctional adenosylcobinamide kinase/adenosylcobinamide-phosphate guanylyltransferase [Alphaproteobacteria bacterium]MDP7190336.1 bifunctional adenosylcobinamide kinase/adenosylcobinamide-phosphate guanylyltransferase [Alphaproteobacteria bacterium]MDP7456586.1 bifunctional adenosylcobinamide kinase/adenosylcobinamide-phosphate guanylyltransferase [Alphaproteob|tara:strand:- start:2819 stop:3400 length:582 start_codon:yes stop_codon:yes gene_type:complete